MPLQFYNLESIGNPLGDSVTGAREIMLAGVGKHSSQDHPYVIVNEYVAGELGRILRLPVPPAGMLRTDDGKFGIMHGTMNFNLRKEALPPVPVATALAALPELCTGILLFDVLIANSDRHRANLALDEHCTPPRLSVFDHSHALLGRRGVKRLQEVEGRFGITASGLSGGNRHCLLDRISTADNIPTWLDRIAAIPDFYIEEICKDTVELGLSADDAAYMTNWLKRRRAGLLPILKDNRGEFARVKQWGLFS